MKQVRIKKSINESKTLKLEAEKNVQVTVRLKQKKILN